MSTCCEDIDFLEHFLILKTLVRSGKYLIHLMRYCCWLCLQSLAVLKDGLMLHILADASLVFCAASCLTRTARHRTINLVTCLRHWMRSASSAALLPGLRPFMRPAQASSPLMERRYGALSTGPVERPQSIWFRPGVQARDWSSVSARWMTNPMRSRRSPTCSTC